MKIESAEENEFLTRTFLTASDVTYWIGLSDQVKEREWIWTDGGPLGNYTNWGDSQPNGYRDQNCGHILKGTFRIRVQSQGQSWLYILNGYNGEWNDLECYLPLGYICEQVSP